MLLVGYCFGIRSERRLCQEVHLNLAYRWFCRLDLADPVPDHSTFSRNRHGRFRDSDLLRCVFETVVARCIAEGLVSGQRLAVFAKDLWIIGGVRTDHGPCMLLAGFQWEVCWICFCAKRRIGSAQMTF